MAATDNELLRRYAEHGSNSAFCELVERYAGGLYASALRQVGDEHRAKDVLQLTFIQLARQAQELINHPTLISWLYTTVHYVAGSAIRAEVRRQAREQISLELQEVDSDVTMELEWSRLHPIIDEAMNDRP